MNPKAQFKAPRGGQCYPLTQPIYQSESGELLEVEHDPAYLSSLDARQWRARFESRRLHAPGPYGSGVWRYHEWVLPDLPEDHIISLGEGGAPLIRARALSDQLGIDLLIKQCGHSHTGSFKDLGMT
ncbi:MAG: threonine synthase, partial [Myxococcota bacterium]